MATADLRRYTELNITVIKGDTLDSTNATFTDDDATNYTGYDSGELLVKTNEADADSAAILSFTTAASSLVLGNGSFYLSKTATLMEIAAGIYYYSMKIVEGVQEITVLKGLFIINERQQD